MPIAHYSINCSSNSLSTDSLISFIKSSDIRCWNFDAAISRIFCRRFSFFSFLISIISYYDGLGSEKLIKAVCDVVIAETVVVHGVRVVEGNEGLFVSFSCERKLNREGVVRHYDIVHPITAETRTDLIEMVLCEYRRQAENTNEVQE